jgi:hypothetical protein
MANNKSESRTQPDASDIRHVLLAALKVLQAAPVPEVDVRRHQRMKVVTREHKSTLFVLPYVEDEELFFVCLTQHAQKENKKWHIVLNVMQSLNCKV